MTQTCPIPRLPIPTQLQFISNTFSPSLPFSREGQGFGQSVCLLTLKGDFVLNAPNAADIADLITMFLDGLRARSQYAVTLLEVSRQGETQGIIYLFILLPYSHSF